VTVSVWVVLLALHADRFIVHDTWKHQFPILYAVARESGCSGLATWLGRVDSGSPVLIYAISTSATQILRLPTLWLMGCLGLDPLAAVSLYKAHVAAAYLVFAAGMYVLGRVLFTRALSAVYLLAATLFSGLFLDVSHSDQVLAILFWWPWIVTATVLAHRHWPTPRAHRCIVAAACFMSAEALDQYPHFLAVATVVGGALAAAVWRPRLSMRGARLRYLWAVLLIAAVTGVQLWLVRNAIVEYQPSLRTSLTVDPAAFDETGFVQPTALIGSVLPVTFLERFERLASGAERWMVRTRPLAEVRRVFRLRRGFIFHLDALVFSLGVVPLVLAAAFVVGARAARPRAWWTAFAVILFLVSLQQSGLYLLLVHVPFFDVFRSYFLYVAFVAFAVLVLSGYGLDAGLTTDDARRRRWLTPGLRLVLAATALAAVAVGLLLFGKTRAWQRELVLGLVWLDVLLVAAPVLLFRWTARARCAERWTLALIGTLVLSHTVYFVAVHRLIGVPVEAIAERYGPPGGVDARDGRGTVEDAERLTRTACDTFAQCYVSPVDTVSLRTDLDGTFLRSRREAVFQHGLEPSVVRALSALTHPIFWLSERAVPYERDDELVVRLNAHGHEIGDHLRRVVHVRRDDMDALGAPGRPPPLQAKIVAVQRARDVVRVTYESNGPALLNAAITYDRSWIARVGRRAVPVRRGNVNGLVVPVAPGRGTVELVYASTASGIFFTTRYLVLLGALAGALLVGRAALWRASREPDAA
jgi:hypothetical protein